MSSMSDAGFPTESTCSHPRSREILSRTAQHGYFVVSLDFELHWGVREKKEIGDYEGNLLGTHSAVPTILKLFEEFDIHATWAIVGFLFFETKEELLASLPVSKPCYENEKLSPYKVINDIGANASEDPFHYAPSLIRKIASVPYQEIGTHTFSHYYCLEPGQNLDTFEHDLKAAARAAERYGLTLESIVFPRNQFNMDYIRACEKLRISAYRGNPDSWLFHATAGAESLLRRGVRLLDAYVNISGHNAYSLKEFNRSAPFNIPASRPLRPYSKRLKALEPLRLHRIKSDLTYAAKNGLMYHLWWHPHNFGVDLKENIAFLRAVLDHYAEIKNTHAFYSRNMGEMARLLKEARV